MSKTKYNSNHFVDVVLTEPLNIGIDKGGRDVEFFRTKIIRASREVGYKYEEHRFIGTIKCMDCFICKAGIRRYFPVGSYKVVLKPKTIKKQILTITFLNTNGLIPTQTKVSFALTNGKLHWRSIDKNWRLNDSDHKAFKLMKANKLKKFISENGDKFVITDVK